MIELSHFHVQRGCRVHFVSASILHSLSITSLLGLPNPLVVHIKDNRLVSTKSIYDQSQCFVLPICRSPASPPTLFIDQSGM